MALRAMNKQRKWILDCSCYTINSSKWVRLSPRQQPMRYFASWPCIHFGCLTMAFWNCICACLDWIAREIYINRSVWRGGNKSINCCQPKRSGKCWTCVDMEKPAGWLRNILVNSNMILLRALRRRQPSAKSRLRAREEATKKLIFPEFPFQIARVSTTFCKVSHIVNHRANHKANFRSKQSINTQFNET